MQGIILHITQRSGPSPVRHLPTKNSVRIKWRLLPLSAEPHRNPKVGSSTVLRNDLHFSLHAFGFHYLLVSMDGKYNAFEMDIVHDKSSTLLSVLEALDTMVYSYSAKNISFVRVGRGLHKLGVYSHGRYKGN